MLRPGTWIALVGLLVPAACQSSSQEPEDSPSTGGVGLVASGGGISMARGGGAPGGAATTVVKGTGGRAMGGSGGSMGGSRTTTGGSGVGGKAVGGTTSAVCQPVDMSSFVYPTYIPARHMAGSCTTSEVSSYYTNCYTNGDCAAFEGGGSNESCGACLKPTPIDGTTQYGPLLQYGSASATVYATNLAGCIELAGDASCAAKFQTSQLCSIRACEANCPATDTASLDALIACGNSAEVTVCADRQAATNCISSQAVVTACTGATFQAQFAALARVFCVN